MDATASAGWWVWLVRGIIGILVGVLILTYPAPSLVILLLAYGAFALVDGFLALAVAIAGRSAKREALPLIGIGILGLAIGFVTFFWPGLTALALLVLVAGWCIGTGVLEIVYAVRFRGVVRRSWVYAVAGLLLILVGAFLIARPYVGLLALVWILGVGAIFIGITRIATAFRLRAEHRATAAV